MKCLVCGEEFKDGWKHALKQGKNGLLTPDEKHIEALDNFNYITESDCVLCGGTLRKVFLGECSWEISCSNCDFLYDED